MRSKVLFAIAIAGLLLLMRNIYVMMLQLPDEEQQGAVYRILFFHVPSAWNGLLAAFVSCGFSLAYLKSRNLKWDAMAAAVTEVGMAFGLIMIVTGMIWGNYAWGIAWTWDARLTSAFVLMMVYFGYLILRQAIDNPERRAQASAVMSIFASADVPIIWFSIRWWRTQHPQPILDSGGTIDPAMKSVLYWNWLAVLLLAVVLVAVRYRQELLEREIESERRLAYAH